MNVDLFRHSFKGGRKIDIADLAELIRHPLRNMATFLYTKGKVKKLFDELNPTLIVTTTEAYYVERFLLEEVSRRGHPSLCLFSVIPVRRAESSVEKKSLAKSRLMKLRNPKALWAIALWLLFHPCKSTLQALGIPVQNMVAGVGRATKVSVWNEEHKEVLVKKGSSPQRVVVTGSPLHDEIYHQNSRSGQKTINKIYI